MMQKKINVLVLAMTLMFTFFAFSSAVSATEQELPEYESALLTPEEIGEFFAAGNAQYGGDLVGAVYDNMTEPEETVYGMKFTATETYDEASAALYADYIADFEIMSSKDVSVLLVGNYGSYGTVPAGVVNLKANEPVRVMDEAAKIFGWKFTYKDIVLLVKEFKCAAVPLTEDVLNAYYTVLCQNDASFAAENPAYNDEVEAKILKHIADNFNPLGAESFSKTTEATELGLNLNLYETDETGAETGNSWTVGESYAFECVSLPDYSSHVLTKAELDLFFNDPNTKYNGALVQALYGKLAEPEKTIYGMNFTSVETLDEADAAPYRNYIADFELTSTEDVSVLLVGNYGSYHTIPLGVVNLEANSPLRVMELARTQQPTWNFNYYEIVLTVKDFDCAAVPLTPAVVKAFYEVLIENDAEFAAANPSYNEAAVLAEILEVANPTNQNSFAITDKETTLKLELKLYENDDTTPNTGATKYDETGLSWVVGDAYEFTYTPEPEESEEEIMQKLLVVYNMENVTKDDKLYHPVHVYAGIDNLNYKEVGFKVQATKTNAVANQTVKTTTVYESMNVINSVGNVTTYTADALGGNYMFGRELLFTAANWDNEDTRLVIVPYAQKLNGTIIEGKEIELTDAIIKARDESSALFKEENK